MEAERLLNDFAAEKLRANNMMRHVKGFLSGAFRYAVRMGTIRVNPMRETMLPKNVKPAQETYAYSLAEILAMLKVLAEPARTVVLVAAFTGLRLSEVRGLKWTDVEDDVLNVHRSVWRKHVSDTKTVASTGTVPLLLLVAEALHDHRKTSTSEYIFAGGTGNPLVIANLTRRDIAYASTGEEQNSVARLARIPARTLDQLVRPRRKGYGDSGDSAARGRGRDEKALHQDFDGAD